MSPQPTKKNNPPNGVIGPSILDQLSIPKKDLVAKRYNDPEKNKIPITKHQPATKNNLSL